MLIIARRVGETIIIDDWLRVTVLKIEGQTIELGLEDRSNKISLQNISVSLYQKIQISEAASIVFTGKKGKQIHLGIETLPYSKVLREELDQENRDSSYEN